MNPLRTIGDNVAGAWLVMLGRPEGLNRLDLSLEGFWRSFAVIVLLVPFALLGLLSQAQIEGPGSDAAAPPGGGWGIDGLALLADWLMFPLVFAALARPLGLGARYVPFIVTRNWASLIIAALVSLIHAAHLVGLLPAPIASFLLLVAVAFALRFSYVIARTTLSVSMAVALPIVILDLLISLTVWTAVDQLAASGP